MNFKTYDSYDLGHKDRAKPVEIDWICDVMNFAYEPNRKIHAVAVVGNVWSTTACHDLCEISEQNASHNKTNGIGNTKSNKSLSQSSFSIFQKGLRQLNLLFSDP